MIFLEITLSVCQGAGRGFCAGGDVATVYHLGKAGKCATSCDQVQSGIVNVCADMFRLKHDDGLTYRSTGAW